MKSEEQREKLNQVIVKASADLAFKQRLLSDPAAVLKEGGVEIPQDVEVRVVEDTAKICHVVLPPPPDTELSDEQLSRVAGGVRGVESASPNYTSTTPF